MTEREQVQQASTDLGVLERVHEMDDVRVVPDGAERNHFSAHVLRVLKALHQGRDKEELAELTQREKKNAPPQARKG